jgi:hypothetical protein
VVYQHSGFDRSAIAAACNKTGQSEPAWDWKDSVQVARKAWPELKGNGGHGLGSLKSFLGLIFEHHDAGEDARAAAEVVLRAEGHQTVSIKPSITAEDDNFDVIENISANMPNNTVKNANAVASRPIKNRGTMIGKAKISQGNINNSHIYLSSFFEAFPSDAIGGSNFASAAPKTISIEWGGHTAAVTDIDRTKKLFRKRSWVREFFERNDVMVGDTVIIEVVSSYSYRVSVERKNRE